MQATNTNLFGVNKEQSCSSAPPQLEANSTFVSETKVVVFFHL